MSRFGTTASDTRHLGGLEAFVRPRGLMAAAIIIVGLSASTAQARMETPEEVDKIMAFLQSENCEIVRDAMGAKKLSASENGFMVEGKCKDGKSYRFMLDQDFNMVSKKEGDF